MKHLSLPRAAEISRMNTAELRHHILVNDLFSVGEMKLVSTELDRLIVGGIVPREPVALPSLRKLGTSYFTERREVGVINIGGRGEVTVGERVYGLEYLECIYIGIGEEYVSFANGSDGQAAFYLLSAPAHRKLPTCKAGVHEARVQEIGSEANASRRKLVQYIHEDGIQSCQLVMGYTSIERGSVWNTWPPHTHMRRSEIYLYFNLGGDLLIHLFGEPGESRHVVVRDRQAVLSPPWSIHSGVGTGAYSFVWGMAGENRTFADMDPVDLDRFG
jgi:4-deoxy-L-threo-5-hexosulose-uronate ketol-isomerase